MRGTVVFVAALASLAAAKPTVYSNTFGGEHSKVNITVRDPDSYRFEYAVFQSPNFNAWEDKKGGGAAEGSTGATKGEYFATLPRGYVCVSYGLSGLSLCSGAAEAGEPLCPGGHIRNPVTGACERSTVAACPVGQSRDPLSGECAPRPCPEGLSRNSLTGNCEPPPCPRGTFRDSSGTCQRPPCPRGKVRDAATGSCVSLPCGEGRVRNPDSGNCEFPPCPLGQVRDLATGRCALPPCPEGQVRDLTGICEDPCPETQVRDPSTGSCACPEGERLNPARGKCQRRVVTDAWVDSDKTDRYVEDKERVIEEYGANGRVEVLDRRGQSLRRALPQPIPSH